MRATVNIHKMATDVWQLIKCHRVYRRGLLTVSPNYVDELHVYCSYPWIATHYSENDFHHHRLRRHRQHKGHEAGSYWDKLELFVVMDYALHAARWLMRKGDFGYYLNEMMKIDVFGYPERNLRNWKKKKMKVVSVGRLWIVRWDMEYYGMKREMMKTGSVSV